MNNSAKLLIDNHGWEEGTALTHAESLGCCRYCNQDLLSSNSIYHQMQIDHLLPKSKYEHEEANFLNWVTCCSSCNSTKGAYDPLFEGEDPTLMLKDQKEDLVKRVITYLQRRFNEKEYEFEAVKSIIRS